MLIGNTGANKLDGGIGNDTTIGGAGNDTYEVNSDKDAIAEYANEGTDQVNSSAFAYTPLRAFVENLTLTGTADINGAGNTLANKITGNGGANVLVGDAGNDTLTGNDGNDVPERRRGRRHSTSSTATRTSCSETIRRRPTASRPPSTIDLGLAAMARSNDVDAHRRRRPQRRRATRSGQASLTGNDAAPTC